MAANTQKAVQDEAALRDAARRANEAIAQQNARVEAALRQTTGLDYGDDPMQWWKWWWQDYNETYNVARGTDQTADSQPPKPEYHYEKYSSSLTYIGGGPVVATLVSPQARRSGR